MASSDELIRLYDQFLDLARFLREQMKTSDTYGDLTLFKGDFQPLLIIAGREGMTQVELSQYLRRSKGATSFIVNKLENWGLVRRVRSDTRCLLYLTEKGRRVCMQKRARDLSAANRLTEQLPLDQEELETANHVMSELIALYRRKYCGRQEET